VRNGKIVEHSSSFFTTRGLANLGCLAILGLGLLALFAGYPIISYSRDLQKHEGLALALGVNASGQVPLMTYGNWGLIDADTPQDAYSIKDLRDGNEWELVFSDEFNIDGRSFYPGDDPVRLLAPFILSTL